MRFLLIFIAGLLILTNVFLGEIWLTLAKMHAERSFRVTEIHNNYKLPIRNYFGDLPSGIDVEKWEER